MAFLFLGEYLKEQMWCRVSDIAISRFFTQISMLRMCCHFQRHKEVTLQSTHTIPQLYSENSDMFSISAVLNYALVSVSMCSCYKDTNLFYTVTAFSKEMYSLNLYLQTETFSQVNLELGLALCCTSVNFSLLLVLSSSKSSTGDYITQNALIMLFH